MNIADDLANAYHEGYEDGKRDALEKFRKEVNRKMQKYTVFGREYIQRIMRETENELVSSLGQKL